MFKHLSQCAADVHYQVSADTVYKSCAHAVIAFLQSFRLQSLRVLLWQMSSSSGLGTVGCETVWRFWEVGDRPAVVKGRGSLRLSGLVSLRGTVRLYGLCLTDWASLPPSWFLSGQLPVEQVRWKGSYATVLFYAQCLCFVWVYFHSWLVDYVYLPVRVCR